jgi:hypothetical protein
MSRTAVAALLLLLASPAMAQETPGPAPSVHAESRLSFPPSLGGATLERSASYGGGSVEYHYSAKGLPIDVVVYNGGRRVPQGSDTPALMSQFTSEVTSAEMQIKGAGMSQFERPTVPSVCPYGSIAFRCIVYSASARSGRFYSKMLMTGYNGYFLKIRIDWSQAENQTQAAADQVLSAFVPALVH